MQERYPITHNAELDLNSIRRIDIGLFVLALVLSAAVLVVCLMDHDEYDYEDDDEDDVD